MKIITPDSVEHLQECVQQKLYFFLIENVENLLVNFCSTIDLLSHTLNGFGNEMDPSKATVHKTYSQTILNVLVPRCGFDHLVVTESQESTRIWQESCIEFYIFFTYMQNNKQNVKRCTEYYALFFRTRIK